MTDRKLAAPLVPLQKLVEEASPFHKLLGFKLLDPQAGKAMIRIDFRRDLMGDAVDEVLHHGVIAGALDFVGALAVMIEMDAQGQQRPRGTVDMRIDFLAPARGRYFVASGWIMRLGHVVCSSRMELANDRGERVAMGTAMYRISVKPAAPPS